MTDPATDAPTDPSTLNGSANADEPIAAVDLGSNSFHMVLARVVHDDIQVTDRQKSTVRLAAGLDEQGYLTEDAQERALECLARFGEMLRNLPPGQVRAVGTNTLRKARNRREFLERAAKKLGHRVEVISGAEEARLVYLGVSHAVGQASVGEEAPGEARRLVVDIGGSSTECVIGAGLEPILTDSLYMGCVSWSLRFFEEEKLTLKRFRKARLAALRELEPILHRYRGLGWRDAVGSSGTIRSIAVILRTNEWTDGPITLEGLERLEETLVAAGRSSKVELQGLKTERQAVLPGGLAILSAVFEGLGLETMTPSSGALREGVLTDLLGRIRHEDRRDQTIRRLAERYGVDQAHAGRVEATAGEIFGQLSEIWELSETDRAMLGWACRIHEIGQALSYSGHHRHGAYIVENSDMPGFSQDDQALLAGLILTHRRKISRAHFGNMPPTRLRRAMRLAVILRLACLLNRSRSPEPLPSFEIERKPAQLTIGFPDGWLDRHRLMSADFKDEAKILKKVNLVLRAR